MLGYFYKIIPLLILFLSQKIISQINPSFKGGLTLGSTSCVLTTATTMTIGACTAALPNSAARLNNTSSSATFGPVSSTAITFGLNNTVELLKDCTIGSSDQAWLFPQNSTIEAFGHVLTLGQAKAIQVSGSATLTIKGANIVIAARDALTCTSTTATVILQDCNLILGYEGLAWTSGNLTVSGNTAVAGYQRVAWPDPSGAELLLRAQNIGFGAIASAYAGSTLYALDFCGPTDERAGITMGRVDKTGAAYFADSFQPDSFTWTAIAGGAVYKHISVGTDGTIWVVNTSNQVIRYRMHKDGWGTTPTNTTASNITAMRVACGDRFNLYALNTSTGIISKCNDPDRGGYQNPLTGAPQSWTSYPDINAISIAAGTDGTFWYIRNDGKAFMNYNGVDTLIHNGEDATFVKISAKGTKDRNTVILTDSTNNRAIICQDNTNWKDLGLSNIVEASCDVDGNVLCIFQNAKIAEDATLGAPLYYRHSLSEMPVLATDRTLTFSANSGANLTIASGSTLTMTQGTTLRMNADCDFADTGYNARRHLVFADSGSTLVFDRANLEAVCAGLTLTQGNIFINGLCRFKASTWENSYLEISSKVKLNIQSGGDLQTLGRVDFCKPSKLMQEITSTNYSTMSASISVASPTVGFTNSRDMLAKRGFVLVPPPNPNATGTFYGSYPNWNIPDGSVTDMCFDGTNMYYTHYNGGGSFVGVNSGWQTDFTASPIAYVTNGRGSGTILAEDASWFWFDGNNVYRSFAGASGGGAYTGSVFIGPASGFSFFNPLTASSYVGITAAGVVYSSNNAATITSNSSSIRRAAVDYNGNVWFINNRGDLKYIAPDTSIKNVKAPRGLDLRFLKVVGSNATNFKLLALSATGKVFTIADSCGGLRYEKLLYTATSGLSCARNSTLLIYNMVGYMLGYAPSTMTYYGTKNLKPLSTTIALTNDPLPYSLKNRGWALLGQTPSSLTVDGWTDRQPYLNTTSGSSMLRWAPVVSGLTTGAANRIYSTTSTQAAASDSITPDEINLSATNPSLYTSKTALGSGSAETKALSVGVDGTIVAAGNLVQLWNGSSWTTLDNGTTTNYSKQRSTGTFPNNAASWTSYTMTTAEYYKDVSCANASNIFKLENNGAVWKWVSGTTWSSISIYPSKYARSISATTDGGLWFVDENGDLRFRSSAGTITLIAKNYNLYWVNAVGSSTDYKLVAVDYLSNLYSGDSTRPLEPENIQRVCRAWVAKNGLATAVTITNNTNYERIYVGWIKGSTVPSTWPYKTNV